MMDLREYQKHPARLADYLPWALLIAPGVILNKDGSFQRTARFRGPDLESSTQAELVSVCARLNDILRRFGSGWALFFEAERHPARDYPHSNWPDPASWIIDHERRASFEAEGAHFESGFYMTFCYLPPEDRVRGAERIFLETPEGRRALGYRDYLEGFITRTDRALDLFQNIMPEVILLDDTETLTYLHTIISTKRHPVSPPEIPIYLDAVLADSPLTGGLEPTLGDQNLRIVTVTGFPGSTMPGILDALNNIGIEYRWVTRYLPMDKTEATKELVKYRRQWFSKRKSITAIVKEVMTNEQSVLVDSDADNKAADADAALQELGDDLVGYGYFTATIIVWDEDMAKADDKLRVVERVINGAGFITIRETVNAIESWLGTLPGNAYANIRQPILSTLNLAHIMPLSAVWAGPQTNEHLAGPPLLMAETGGATPFRLVTHQGDVGHTIIVGPTGAGKSVLLALLAMQFRRYQGSQVYMFDKGGSARAATLAMGGKWYDLGAEDALSFQPLAAIDKDRDRAWAQDWICDLLTFEGVTVTPDIKETVWSAIQNLVHTPPEERTLTGLSVLLQSNDIRQALQPYTLNGPHGRLLDADMDNLAIDDVQCFEMEDLMHSGSVALPVLTYLFHRLEERFNGRPTFLILDEAWVFLDDPAFAGRIREWLKVLRKKNVSVIFATQSLTDIANSSIAPAIIESCPSRIFLPNERATEPQQKAVYEAFGLNSRQIEIISRAAPRRDYYFQSRQGNRLFDLGLGPIALAFTAASNKQDQNLIARLSAELTAAKAPNTEFAARYLSERNLTWASELILEYGVSNAQ